MLIALVPSFEMHQDGINGVSVPSLVEPSSAAWFRLLACGDEYQGVGIALLAPSLAATCSSKAEFEDCVRTMLHRVMRLDPADTTSPAMCTMLWCNGHGAPGVIHISESPEASMSVLTEIPDLVISLLPNALREYLRLIHYDSCSSLKGVSDGDLRGLPSTAPIKNMVLTGYNDTLHNDTSVPLGMVLFSAACHVVQQSGVNQSSSTKDWRLKVASALASIKFDKLGPPVSQRGNDRLSLAAQATKLVQFPSVQR